MKKKSHKKWYIIGGIIVILIIWWVVASGSKPEYDATYVPKPLLGNPEATVKIVEFADFQCPACGAAHPQVKSILDEFSDDVSYEFKHFPLNSIHPFAQLAAEASECANDQGKFHEYADVLFSNQQDLRKNDLKYYAVELGLDSESFDACLDSRAKKASVRKDQQEGVDLSLRGTPSFFINGKPVRDWSYSGLKTEIEAELR